MLASPIKNFVLACATLVCSLFLAATPSAFAQAYPDHIIKVINPYPPGGTSDLLMRLMLPSLQERFGKTIIIESHPGAAGIVGAELVARAPPDGYTLLTGTTNIFVINQFVFSKLRIDPLKAFAPIARVADIPFVFYASNAVPANNLKEFVNWVKSNPGKVTYATSGIGTTQHLAIEQLRMRTGIDLLHLPYQGQAAAITAVLTNEVQLHPTSLSGGLTYLRTGKLKALAVLDSKRLPQLPDVPTVAENGIKLDPANWFALVAPAGTPSSITERWSAEVRRAL